MGSFPGDDQRAYDDALATVLGELGADDGRGVVFVPEVPGRGAIAGMVGRTLGLLGVVLDADLQPGGWRLTGTSGAPALDQRRAASLLAQDLDALEEHAQGYRGALKTQVVGPLTLAAVVERPRGDKLLADHGARRELAEAGAEAVRAHVADLRRRVPEAAGIVVQIDEPALPAVLAGSVPTASGFGRHRVVHPPEASESLARFTAAVEASDAEPWVHCCAPGAPVGLLRGAGARGVLLDLGLVDAAAMDEAAEALEAGTTVGLGVVATADPAADLPGDAAVVERVLRWLDAVGLDPEQVTDSLVLTPACGLAGLTPGDARRVLGLLRAAARSLG